MIARSFSDENNMRERHFYMNMIKVSGIFTYPIKSCGGISHQSATLDERGLRYDRRWMIVSDAPEDRGEFLTQREFPRLSLIQPSFSGDMLAINAPGMSEICVPLAQQGKADRDVVVWDDTCRAVDQRDQVAEWLSNFMAIPIRLVRIADEFVRPTSMDYTDQPAQTGFADGYPMLLTTEDSLIDLNKRLAARGKPAIRMNRFRPNIVVKGADPFEEDLWKWIKIGDIRVEIAKPCARCVTTTVEQERGEVTITHEPTATLATFRRASNGGVMFGQNVIHRTVGEIAIGDEVQILAGKM
jgi:uncharacterized protein YcbX